MAPDQSKGEVLSELDIDPFFYEIHVKGRLSQEKWLAWFDNLSISAIKGETVLRGTLTDHSALYGLLSRLRDLAIPLISVNVLDAEAQNRLLRRSKGYDLWINLLLALVYLLLLGVLISLTVFSTAVVHVALALALLIAVSGGLAYIFYIWNGNRFWRILAYILWPGAMLTFFIYLAVAELVHPALAISALLLMLAGGLIYLIYHLRARLDEANNTLIDWEKLSCDDDNSTQIEKFPDA